MNTSQGMNPIQAFCNKTGFPFLGEAAAVVPIIFEFGKRTQTTELIIILHHGWGGTNSRQKGADVNKYIQYSKGFDNFDISLFGHTHNFLIMPDIILDCRTKKQWVEEKIILVGVCGTFLKTLGKGKDAPYSERNGYPARIISWGEIDIGFKEDHIGSTKVRYPHIVPSS